MGAVPRRLAPVPMGFRAIGRHSGVDGFGGVVTGVGSIVTGIGTVVASLRRPLVLLRGLIPVIGDPVSVVAGLARGLGTATIDPSAPFLTSGHQAMMAPRPADSTDAASRPATGS